MEGGYFILIFLVLLVI